jgi:hypothetical protein
MYVWHVKKVLWNEWPTSTSFNHSSRDSVTWENLLYSQMYFFVGFKKSIPSSLKRFMMGIFQEFYDGKVARETERRETQKVRE